MDSLDFFRAIVVLANDWIGQEAESIFFHGRAAEDHDGLFELASAIHVRMKTKIVLNGSSGERFGGNLPGEAWPGKSVYRNFLTAHGIGDEWIFYSRPAFHTYDENEAFLEWAIQNKIRKAIVIGHPHQIPRIFLGALHALRKSTEEILIYSAAPKCVDWTKKVGCNQGIEYKPRHENIGDELSRIIRGQEEYKNLVSYSELFSYLEYRNKAR